MRALFLSMTLIAFCGGSAAAQAQSEYWYVGSVASGGRVHSTMFIDVQKFEAQGAVVLAAVESFVAADAPAPLTRIERTVYINEYDCNSRRYRNRQMTAYLRNDPTPKSHDFADNEGWFSETPSTSYHDLTFVCTSPSDRAANRQFRRLPGDVAPQDVAQGIFDARPRSSPGNK